MNIKNLLIKNALFCFTIFGAITLLVVFSSKVHLGFFGNIALFLSGAIFTTIGVVIGDAIRHFVAPDAFLSSSATETFKTKIFWMIGPQVIGWIIGYIAANGFMKNVLGYAL